MSVVRMIGCLHLGHKWMAEYRGFKDDIEHDKYIIEQWNKITHKKDLTYILGDITMEKSNNYYQLDRLKGRKIVVLGNHCKWQHVPEMLKYVDGVAGMIDYKGFCLTHAPIHPCEMGRYRGNIHAHIHHINKLIECEVPSLYQNDNSVITKTLHKYHCVDAKLIDYKPKTIEQLINYK